MWLFPTIICGTKTDSVSHQVAIRSQLRKWDEEGWRTALEIFLATEVQPKSRMESETESRGRKVRALIEMGRMSDAMQQLQSKGHAKAGVETLEELRRLNPSRELPQPPEPLCEVPPVEVTVAQVKHALKSFKPGTGAGPSGVKAPHLKGALAKVEESTAERFFESLTKMLNVIIAGKAPRELAEHVAGGRLFAFLKPDDSVRPVCCGETLRRLLGKASDESRSAQASGSVRRLAGRSWN